MTRTRCLPTLLGVWSLVALTACGAGQDDSPAGGHGGQPEAGGDGGTQNGSEGGAAGTGGAGHAAAAGAAAASGVAGQGAQPSAGGTVGTGGQDGAAGSGGTPGLGGIAGEIEVELAPYTVFSSGEVSTTAQGCVTNTSADTNVSTWLLMDEPITDGTIDLDIAGELLPAGEYDPASIWVHFFATLDGRRVASSVALDLRHTLIGLYRYQPNDQGADWITVGEQGEQALSADPTRAYRVRVEASLDLFSTSTVQATLGTETATVRGDNIGTAEGTQLLLRFQNATICRFVF